MYRPWYIAKWQNLIPLIVLLSAIYGSEAALTDAIFHGKTEVLVTPGLVRKEGLTLDTCASACVAEKTIKCQFFKFINSTKTCYLSETDHPKIKHVGINTPVGSSSSGNGKSSKGSKFDDLQKSIDRLKNVQKKVENLVETDDEKSSSLKDLQRQSVKQVKAIVTLDGRLRSLHSQVSDIRGDLSDLQKSQTTIARNLQSVRSSTGNLGSNVKRLAHLAGELNSNVEDVKLFNSSILRQLARVSHSTSNLDKKLNRLSSYLHDKKIFNPDNMQQSQFRIAKGMAVLAQSQKTFWHQLHGLEHTVSMLTATLGRESRGHGHTQSALLNLQTSVHNIKLALAKLSDPMSIQNRQWQGDVNSIKHVLSTLAGTNSRLDGEMKSNRREVASVIKDLANVQMAVQSLKSNVAGIQSTNSDLLESVQDLLKTKTKIPSIVQMTKISTTILKSLSAIDRKERILTSRMKQFGDSLYSIEKKMQTKNTANRLQKHALIQLTRRVKDLSRDMQRINKLVMNINKKTPSTKGAQQIEVVQRKLVLAISQLQTRLSGIEVQMKRGQSAIEKNSVKTAANLVTKLPLGAPQKQGPACPSGYQRVDFECFLYLSTPFPYYMAKQQCQSRNGSIPEITSIDMQRALQIFLLETRAEVPSVWLSSTVYNTHAKKWYWERSGDPLLFENYMMDPPAGQEGEMCNQFRVEWASHWSASPCNQDIRLPTVCHHESDNLFQL
ncbi:myosin heavy chain, clone 203-like isoform X5 [Argopecten irradians]|uniref:myosin heavy chain, clone 203-like isoform X5 n=1 Tax=Argopecten irradians TaxID=31199 RepID=UPI0037122722